MLRSWWTPNIAMVVFGVVAGVLAGLGDWSVLAIHASTWVGCAVWFSLVFWLKPWENANGR